MSDTHIPALTPEDSLLETARFTATHAGLFSQVPSSPAWLVTGASLMAQQAAALALNGAGDSVPAKVGAAELLLRAANRDRLPPPFTLPFSASARRDFDLLVEVRNSFMHPRAQSWHVTPRTLSRGLPVASAAVRHLILTQPVVPDIISPADTDTLRDCLEQIEDLALFLGDEA
ncbi:MAG: hypothetical protein Hens3KO_11220 [Henriciella sp.]